MKRYYISIFGMIIGIAFILILSINMVFQNQDRRYIANNLYNIENILNNHIIQISELIKDIQILNRIYLDGQVLLNRQTLLIYEYYNPETGEINIIEQYSPYFLNNISIEELSNIFINWEILEYNPYMVRLRKNIGIVENQKYIIGEQNGNIAIWEYGTEIVEITNRPISALAIEEQERLRYGILVNGNKELIRALEDFGS